MLDLDTLADQLLAHPPAALTPWDPGDGVRDTPPTNLPVTAPIWVQVRQTGSTTTVALSAQPDPLLGWVAPPECAAVGVLAPGRAIPWRPHDRAGRTDTVTASDRPGGDGATRVQVLCLLGRDGQVVSRLTGPDGAVTRAPATGGYLLDCFARCLGRPTPPPPEGPSCLVAAVWLEAVHDAGRTRRQPLTWEEVLALHPLSVALGADGPAAHHLLQATLGAICGGGAPAPWSWSWETLRSHVVAGAWPCSGITPEIAAWMDDGMFARWVLASIPPADRLLDTVPPYLTAEANRRLRDALGAVCGAATGSSTSE